MIVIGTDHNTGGDEDIRVSLVNDFQTSRTFKVRINDHDVLLAVDVLVQLIGDSIAEHHSISTNLLCTANVEVWEGSRFDGIVDGCDGTIELTDSAADF